MPVKEANIIQILNHSSLKELSAISSALLPDERLSDEGSYWHISNKYYSARVRLSLEGSSPGGVILYLSGPQEKKFDELSVLNNYEDSEVRLIVVDGVPEDFLSRAFMSAIPSAGWELVDLSEEEEEEDEGLCGKSGLGRVAEALQTVAWESYSKDGENGKEEDLESFEKLFAQLASFKSTANSLSDDERKKYTENVIKSFWRAMGGDEEEIAGLSDEEEQ
eukprot:TRINITY_DN2719_c0_g1_i1.p1 TRINITY_DN2719_c0_g1~~TRINITY_DN2719_c0_g1_i1.p1  ORF type:complete len:221 (-),score=91.55 TRINITY_DN2719_c0_g1_i1:72-734(-)